MLSGARNNTPVIRQLHAVSRWSKMSVPPRSSESQTPRASFTPHPRKERNSIFLFSVGKIEKATTCTAQFRTRHIYEVFRRRKSPSHEQVFTSNSQSGYYRYAYYCVLVVFRLYKPRFFLARPPRFELGSPSSEEYGFRDRCLTIKRRAYKKALILLSFSRVCTPQAL